MSFFSDSYHLFIRWMKKLVRNPILVFFSLFQPIIFLVLFTQLFSKFGSLIGPGVSYTVFATAGIVLQNAFSSAFQSGTSVVDDIKSGFLTKMLATPVNRSAILFGRILSDMFRVAVQTIIILALAYVLGVYPQTGVPGYVLVILTVGFFGLAWSGISLALGLKTKSGETVFGIAGFLTFPLLFMSTALVGSNRPYRSGNTRSHALPVQKSRKLRFTNANPTELAKPTISRRPTERSLRVSSR